MTELLSEAELERSDVVANGRMNRERGISGVNSYTRELGFDPVVFLRSRLEQAQHASWLDLCCGTGRALAEAAQNLDARACRLEGVDLVPLFGLTPPEVRLTAASVAGWIPDGRFDLITCVHGLHYIGDKLGLLQRAAGWLADGGLLAAHLDLKNIRLPPGQSIRNLLKKVGFTLKKGERLVVCQGPRVISFPYRFVGGDDRAGPNFTLQEAVDSYYVSKPGFAG